MKALFSSDVADDRDAAAILVRSAGRNRPPPDVRKSFGVEADYRNLAALAVLRHCLVEILVIAR